MAIVHLLGGGTYDLVRPHLALAAPAFGATARALAEMAPRFFPADEVRLGLTRMADPASAIVTNDDVAALLDRLVAEPQTKVIVQSMALADFRGSVDGTRGKDAPRLRSDAPVTMDLVPAEKIADRVRKARKDIFLVLFKTTAGASEDEQFEAGARLCKRASANLVLANDLQTRTSMIVTPELARYHVTRDRGEALSRLLEMTALRSKLTFHRTTVVPGDPVPWYDVHPTLRTVVEHCIARGAYKPFLGVTVGHFAIKLADGSLLSSRRKTDHNRVAENGLVRVDASHVAWGSKPSAGERSQRMVLDDHPGLDCIVHFHCPMREGARVPVREQRPYECGSLECGRNTSDGLAEIESGIWAVMLEKHGPNICFSKDIDPARVTAFIDRSFDLGRSTSVS